METVPRSGHLTGNSAAVGLEPETFRTQVHVLTTPSHHSPRQTECLTDVGRKHHRADSLRIGSETHTAAEEEGDAKGRWGVPVVLCWQAQKIGEC